MRIGYARVSTTEQILDLQRDALKRSGCERNIEETASGGKVQRSGLERVQEMLRQGDVLAVWRLDGLGRSLKHLIEVIGGLEDQGIGFHSVTESIDTTTPGGKLVFHPGCLSAFQGYMPRSGHTAGVPSTTPAILEMPCVSALARSRWRRIDCIPRLRSHQLVHLSLFQVFPSNWLKWQPCGRILVGVARAAFVRRTVSRGIMSGWPTPEE